MHDQRARARALVRVSPCIFPLENYCVPSLYTYAVCFRNARTLPPRLRRVAVAVANYDEPEPGQVVAAPLGLMDKNKTGRPHLPSSFVEGRDMKRKYSWTAAAGRPWLKATAARRLSISTASSIDKLPRRAARRHAACKSKRSGHGRAKTRSSIKRRIEQPALGSLHERMRAGTLFWGRAYCTETSETSALLKKHARASRGQVHAAIHTTSP